MKNNSIPLWPFFFAALLSLLSGCALPGQVQRNKAGTRSVSLAGIPEDSRWSDAADREPLAEVRAAPGGQSAPDGPEAGGIQLLSVPVPESPGPAGAPEPPRAAGVPASLPGDIIDIREKLFIAQTNEIYLNAGDYMGKTIRLEGLFKSEFYEDTGTGYCFVIRYGPGCCGNDGSAGFEVAWDSPVQADKPYPNTDDWVEAVGVLQNYEEDGYPYLYLSLVSLTVKDERGEEFVAQ